MPISEGSRGEEVKELQRAINAAGYTPPLVVDGIFGPKTTAGNKWLYEHNQSQGSAGSGSGGGSGSSPQLDTGTPDRYTDGDNRFIGLGGNPEIWYNSDTQESYIVFTVPNSQPPIPAFWRIEKDEHLKAYFGTKPVMYDSVMTNAEMTSVGALYQGLNTELVDREGDPMTGIIDRINRDIAVRPYLEDPSVVAIIMASALEGTTPSEAEFQQTDWWQQHNERERSWLVKTAADPKTAQQAIGAGRIQVKAALEAAGVYAPDDKLVNYLADQYTMGKWDQTYLTEQVNTISDPAYSGVLDQGVQDVIDGLGSPLNTNTDEVAWVKAKALEWLGPVHGGLSDQQVGEIAGRIRNDPNYRDEWITSLQGSRQTLYPEYSDTLATYDEIAQPWRSVYFETLGEQPDETSTLFQESVRNNDLASTRASFMRYGIQNNNGKATTDALGALARAYGNGARSVV